MQRRPGLLPIALVGWAALTRVLVAPAAAAPPPGAEAETKRGRRPQRAVKRHGAGDDAAAKRLLVEARELFANGLFSRSRARLDRARELAVAPALRARIELLSGLDLAAENQMDRAHQAFARALHAEPSLRLDPQQYKPDVVRALDQERARVVGRLELSVEGAASVSVDGVQLSGPPYRVDLVAGQHRVVVAAAGRKPRRARVDVAASETRRLSVHLDPLQQPEPAAQQGPGPDEERSLAADDSAGVSWISVAGWTSLGLAAVSMATAIGLGLSATGEHDDACAMLQPNGPCDQRTMLRSGSDPERYRELHDAVQSKQLAVNVLWGVAGAFAVGSAVLLVMHWLAGEHAARSQRSRLNLSLTASAKRAIPRLRWSW